MLISSTHLFHVLCESDIPKLYHIMFNDNFHTVRIVNYNHEDEFAVAAETSHIIVRPFSFPGRRARISNSHRAFLPQDDSVATACKSPLPLDGKCHKFFIFRFRFANYGTFKQLYIELHQYILQLHEYILQFAPVLLTISPTHNSFVCSSNARGASNLCMITSTN